MRVSPPECDRIKSLVEQLELLEQDLSRVAPSDRDNAVEQVASVRAELLDLLSDILIAGDDSMRRTAAYGLSKLQDARCVPLLIGALSDSDETVRGWAAEGLAASRNSVALTPLVRALRDESVYVYYSACSGLKAIRSDDLWPLLQQELQSPQSFVRKRVIKLLGDLREHRALPQIMEYACDDEDAGARYEAVEALRKIGDRRAVDTLVSCLEDESHEVRCGAIQALRWMGDSRAVESLIRVCLENEDLRLLSIQALRDIAGDEAIGPVVQALHRMRELVRSTADKVLSRTDAEHDTTAG